MKPIPLSFSNCLRDGVFPNDWKKANVIPVHKKRNKQLVSNYRPVLYHFCRFLLNFSKNCF